MNREVSPLEQRSLDCIVPSLIFYIFQNYRKSNDAFFKDEDNRRIFLKMDAVVRERIGRYPMVAIKQNVACRQISRYVRKELKNTKKSLLVIVEWAFALHDAGAIDIGELGYGDELVLLDEKLRLITNEKEEKSADKHVPKLHAEAAKYIII